MNDSRLLHTNDPAEKAALLADSILKLLPKEIALLAKYFIIVHWFDQIILDSLLNTTEFSLSMALGSSKRRIYEQFVSLPFIEVLTNGITFNTLTREGLLNLYARLEPGVLKDAAEKLAPIYKALEEYGAIAAEAFFCYIVAGNSQAANLQLERLLQEAVCREDWQYITGILHLRDEAEQLSFVKPFPLSEQQWILQGLAYQEQDELDLAIIAYHHAIEKNTRNIQIHMVLGAIYFEQQHYEKALLEYNSVLEYEPAFVQALINKGIVYISRREYESAIKNLQQAIQYEPVNSVTSAYYIQAVIGLCRTATASENSLNHQVFIHFYSDGEPFLNQILAINEKTLSSTFLELATSFSLLAQKYYDQGQYEAAELLLKQALNIYEKILEPEGLEVAAALIDIARNYKAEDKYNQSELCLRRALVIYESLLGSSHSNTAKCLTNLVELLQMQGKYEQAKLLLRPTSPINKHVIDSNDLDTTQSLQGSEPANINNTLSSLVRRALSGNLRPLEFYLRDHSRLPGPRANMELANDVGLLFATSVPKYPENVWKLINHFVNGDRKKVAGNTPEEFVMLCGVIAFGTCAAAYAPWREESFGMLEHYACSDQWRVREGVVIAFQHLLQTIPYETVLKLTKLAMNGNYLQQRAAIASIAEPPLLSNEDLLEPALQIQKIVLDRLRKAPKSDRKTEELRTLRRTLGYTLSVVTIALPEQGFALMRECATWNDADILWILRENLKKKRLVGFVKDTETLSKMIASSGRLKD